ncbi:MAG: ABC transporter ATP-binding protein [Candidatus Riflebacteria bacterium]|jgi:ABC-type Fe3+/spermidine/putrescine transport system ATPase subunit|nr:ABC transporter ATP-binding protein [Candidatus Riflebacteria bacterium]
MIEFNRLCAKAGAFSLENIDISIFSGDCHVIVGPTGAGKTFLLETLVGLRDLSSGSILINSSEISSLPPRDRKISYVPQDTCLFPNMTVRENIMYGIRMGGIDHQQAQPLVDHLIDFLRIGHILERYPGKLSGGEKQRVALARALVPRPLLLVLDEPFSAIDHSMREEIRRLIKELLDAFKTTTLIVTHDLDEAFFLGDHISIMLNGQILQSGDRERMYYYPRTYQAASFLGIKNIFPARVEEVVDGSVTIRWEAMNESLTIPCHCSQKRFTRGQQVAFGIRAEAVYIQRPGHEKTLEHVFSAMVKKIYLRGRMHTILVETGQSQKLTIEIDIHDAAAQKIGIREGEPVRISILPRWVFLISDVDTATMIK